MKRKKTHRRKPRRKLIPKDTTPPISFRSAENFHIICRDEYGFFPDATEVFKTSRFAGYIELQGTNQVYLTARLVRGKYVPVLQIKPL